ncbi:hypothetical protein G6O69_01565 [Pseudenhygromyxa sp. WMMC2535]|uniref:hypothetical protein n=1 Tax=Pseudenhygromyxa sp. WMMC2535 TaxID=2712867 RepID=UPI001594ECB5|nr:hypothetical protein [Pseudenhygromyxa sp. WMMC2535]NVB36501.1 hypothetical protein [Pseudenhygromyxa sp. WMMC2535]
MTEQRGVHHIQVGKGYVSTDMSFFPIVPLWWAGEMSPKLFDEWWAYRDREMLGRVPAVVLVHDINDINPVTPTTRKYLADLAKKDAPIQAGETFSIVTVASPVLRGVMTAVTWMAGDRFPVEFVPSVRDGFKAAIRHYKKRGIEEYPIVDASDYVIKKNPNAKL